MKMPAIPQECGLTVSKQGIAYHHQGATFDTIYPQGRAALAAYCMAVIDEMIRDSERASKDLDVNAWRFMYEYRRWLYSWRAELSRYGGFTK